MNLISYGRSKAIHGLRRSLANLVQSQNCLNNLEQFFLFNSNNGKLTCIPKTALSEELICANTKFVARANLLVLKIVGVQARHSRN